MFLGFETHPSESQPHFHVPPVLSCSWQMLLLKAQGEAPTFTTFKCGGSLGGLTPAADLSFLIKGNTDRGPESYVLKHISSEPLELLLNCFFL